MSSEAITDASQDPKPSSRLSARRRRWRLALLGLVALSLGLNWWGADWGLPDIWHPDAHRYVAAPWIMSYGNLNPRISCNPMLFTAVMFAEREAIRLWFWLFGTHEGLLRFRDRAGLTLAGRLTSGAFAAACVLLVFRLGASIAGRRAGAAGAVLLAVNFLLVRTSHFALNDIPMVCCLLICAERSVAYLRWGRLGFLWQAAAVSGVAFATKYSGGTAIFPPLMAALVCHRARALRQRVLIAMACGGLFAIGALLANPYFLLDEQYYLHDFLFMLRSEERCTDFSSGGVPTWLSFPGSLRMGAGWVGSIVGVVGLGLMACRRRRLAVVMLTGPLVYSATICTRTVAYPRYVLPATPFLVIGFAFALSHWSRRLTRPALWLSTVVIAATIEPAAKSVRFDVLCSREDTRSQAKRWIERHIPPDAGLIVDGNFPAMPTHPHAFYVVEKLLRYGPRLAPDYFVSNLMLRGALRRLPGTAESVGPIYEAMESACPVVAEFYPASEGTPLSLCLDQTTAPLVDLWATERPGPPIRIYQLGLPRRRPFPLPVRQKRPFTDLDWRIIASKGVFPEASLAVAPTRPDAGTKQQGSGPPYGVRK